jgi:UDP-GlcNAc:undecaprenyl-phosphate/decaprenyl-phosphate GlcNAc-1-phosphate transferase
MGLGALAVSALVTWAMSRWAGSIGLVDQPGHRKMHVRPVPLGGGIAIFWTTALPVAAAAGLALWWSRTRAPAWLPGELGRHLSGIASRAGEIFVLLTAAAVLHLLGLVDDKLRLGPGIKLLVQILAAAMAATGGGVRFDFFIPIPAVTTVLSIVWLVVIINAFNFLDNMDGLSAGVAAICCSVILWAAGGGGQVFISGFLAIFIGALLGFLIFNFAPAKIFMGDAGSLVVGFFVGAASVRTTYYHQDTGVGGWYATLMPLIVLAVPLYDFTSVVILRVLQGKSPFVGDQQHFSHRLVRRGLSVRQAVLTIYLATGCTAAAGTFLHELPAGAAWLAFGQTILILMIIAIMERPPKIKN